MKNVRNQQETHGDPILFRELHLYLNVKIKSFKRRKCSKANHYEYHSCLRHQHLTVNKRADFGDACVFICPIQNIHVYTTYLEGWSNDAKICDVSVTASAGGDRDQTGLGCSVSGTATSEQETGGRTPDSEGSRNRDLLL